MFSQKNSKLMMHDAHSFSSYPLKKRFGELTLKIKCKIHSKPPKSLPKNTAPLSHRSETRGKTSGVSLLPAINHLRSPSRDLTEPCSRTFENLPKFSSRSPRPPLVAVVRQNPVVVQGEKKSTSRDIRRRDFEVGDQRQRMRTGLTTSGLHAGR